MSLFQIRNARKVSGDEQKMVIFCIEQRYFVRHFTKDDAGYWQNADQAGPFQTFVDAQLYLANAQLKRPMSEQRPIYTPVSSLHSSLVAQQAPASNSGRVEFHCC